MANQKRNDGQLTEYTSESKETYRHRNWRGAWVETITLSEHYQSWSHNQNVLLSQDGKAVSPEKIQKEREAAARFMETDTKTKPASSDAKGIESDYVRGHFWLNLYQIYRQSVFGPPGASPWMGAPVSGWISRHRRPPIVPPWRRIS